MAYAASNSRTEQSGGENSDTPMLLGFTNEQVQRLLSLIESSKPGYEKLSGKASWILDTGASNHMTGDLKALEGLEKIKPVPVGMPNGVVRLATLQGTLNLSPKIKLTKVLYVPNFVAI